MIKYRCYGCLREIETMSECEVKCSKCCMAFTKVGGHVDKMKDSKKGRKKKQ